MNGLIPATIVDTADPQMRGRVRLSIPELFYDAETDEIIPSPWCEPKGGGGRGVGELDVPEVGSVVWCQAVYDSSGEVLRFVYERGTHGAGPDGSYIPPTGLGKDDESVQLKVSAPFEVPSARTMLRKLAPNGATVRREAVSERVTINGAPTSANAGEYPRNKVRKTASGFVIEEDSTPGQERFAVHHPSGASVEVNAQGVWVERTSKRWSEIMEHDTQRVGGDVRRRVDGSVTESVGQNAVQEVSGRKVILASEIDLSARFDLLMQIGGQLQQKITGNARLETLADTILTAGGRMSLSAAGGLNLTGGLGAIRMATAQDVNITSVLGMQVSGPVGLNVTPLGTPGQPVALAPAVVTALSAIVTYLNILSGAWAAGLLGQPSGPAGVQAANTLTEVTGPAIGMIPSSTLRAASLAVVV